MRLRYSLRAFKENAGRRSPRPVLSNCVIHSCPGTYNSTRLKTVFFLSFALILISAGAVCGQFEDLPALSANEPENLIKHNQGTKASDSAHSNSVQGDQVERGSFFETFDEVFQIPHVDDRVLLANRTPRKPIDASRGIGSGQDPDGSNNEDTTEPGIARTEYAPPVAKNTFQSQKTIRQLESPYDYRPWWQNRLTQEALGGKHKQTRSITVDQLVLSMIQNSPEVKALQQEPIIASTYVDVENAKFDPISFVESKFDDSNEPVGDTLTTTNSPFLKEHIVTAKAGLRKKTQIGTEFELAQNVGFKNSNSNFLSPNNQGTSRLVLNVDQPLLNGAGRVVGTSRILLAEIDSTIASANYEEKLQEKILSVIKAYWEFYLQKSVLILRTKNYESAVEILRQLKGRESFDAQRSQVIRAEAAVAARRLNLIRSRTDVQNAETIIREITRDPRLGKLGITNPIELIPGEFPQINDAIFPDLAAAVKVAFHNRPEIDQAMERIKAAGIQNNVAKNQLLPQLKFLFNVYAAALEGNSGVPEAWKRQFVDTTPGYSAGLTLEYPIYNRAAFARKQRVEAQMNKLSSELDDTLGSVTAEVEIAYRELKMSLEAIRESRKSILAAEKDQAFIQKRWKNFAFLQENPNFTSPTVFLEQLLDAQDRITQAQIQYANSTRQFMIAVAELRKAEGSLLNYQHEVTLDPPQSKSGELPEFAPDADVPAPRAN